MLCACVHEEKGIDPSPTTSDEGMCTRSIRRMTCLRLALVAETSSRVVDGAVLVQAPPNARSQAPSSSGKCVVLPHA